MKLKHTLLALTLCTGSLGLISCDGGSSGGEEKSTAERDAETAESILTPERGDEIYYRKNDNTTPLESSLNFEGATTRLEEVTYEYFKTGDHTFSITRSSSADPTVRLTTALDNVLGNRVSATDAQLGSRLRDLMHRDEPNFTDAEKQEIIRILNPSGTVSIFDEDTSDIISLNYGLYRHTVTSTNIEQSRGSMGGTYTLELTGVVMDFRKATDEEASNYRFFSVDDYIPYITTAQVNIEQQETGVFTIDLVNAPQN